MIKRRRNKLEGERKFNQEGRGAFLGSIKGKIALMGGGLQLRLLLFSAM